MGFNFLSNISPFMVPVKGDVELRTEIQKLNNFSNFKPVVC